MDPSHIVMHVALCSALTRQAASQAGLPVHVTVSDRLNRPQIDQTFNVRTDGETTGRIEYDLPFGTYRASLKASAKGASCTDVEYFTVIAEHNRSVPATLQAGSHRNVVPMLVMGSSPFSFSYVQPTLMVFGKQAKCNSPVGDPIQTDLHLENDADSYYASIFPTAQLAAQAPIVVAMQMKDAQGGYHYVRLPGQFQFSNWPTILQFNVTEDVIDYVADKPEDTLLCPHMYKTSVQ